MTYIGNKDKEENSKKLEDQKNLIMWSLKVQM